MIWQPIETAPKDGRAVLLYFPDEPTAMWTGWYYNREERNHGKVTHQSQGWATGAGVITPGSNPTHWMPLPAPPSEGRGGDA